MSFDFLVPTATISIGEQSIAEADKSFKIKQITINPIFKRGKLSWWRWYKFASTKSRLRFSIPFLQPTRERDIELWIELVIGHKDETSNYEIPDVIYEYKNTKFKDLSKSTDSLDGQELVEERVSTLSSKISTNYHIYSHFWFANYRSTANREDQQYQNVDLPLRVYGKQAKRVVPRGFRKKLPAGHRYLNLPHSAKAIEYSDKIEGALAFTRIVANEQKRINYPAAFGMIREEVVENLSYRDHLFLRLFNIDDRQLNPLVSKSKLNHEETLSFWHHFRYTEKTGSYADDEFADRFSLIFHFKFLGENLDCDRVNFFPRLPFRYKVETSTPKLEISARLPSEPPPWTSSNDDLYPSTAPKKDPEKGEEDTLKLDEDNVFKVHMKVEDTRLMRGFDLMRWLVGSAALLMVREMLELEPFGLSFFMLGFVAAYLVFWVYALVFPKNNLENDSV